MTSLITRFALAFVIAAIILLGATGNLLSSSPVVIGLQLAAIALAIWARTSFPAGTFRAGATPAAASVIRRGPYRLIRHPMYSATLLFLWSAILSHISTWTLLVGLAITVIVGLRIVLEETVLREQLGEHEAYCKETKALIPYLL